MGQTGVGLSDLQHVRFQRIETSEGLPSATVTSVTQDRQGGIWLGTDSGLCRFDGSEMRIQHHAKSAEDSLSSDRISALEWGHEGQLWVGTSNAGLNVVDPTTGETKRFLGSERLEGSEILTMKADGRGFLWVGTGEGLLRLDQATDEVIPFLLGSSSTRVAVIEHDTSGDVWVGLMDGGLYRIGKENQVPVRVWKSPNPVTALAIDHRGALWVGTHGSGLFRLSLNTPDSQPLRASRVGVREEEIPSRVITSLHCDRQGHLWVAGPHGVSRLDRENQRSALYRHDPLDNGSLSGNMISALFEDRGGNLWIATDGAGVNSLDLNRFGFALVRVKPPSDGKEIDNYAREAVWGLCERPDGSAWIGTEAGLSHWHPDRGWLYDVPVIRSLEGGNGSKSEGTPLFVQAILEDQSKGLWLGTRGEGLYRVNPKREVTHLTHTAGVAGGLPHDSVTVLHQDRDGSLWVGTLGGGVARMMETGTSISFLAAITNPKVRERNLDRDESTPADREPSTPVCRHVTAIARDGAGRTWVASWEGLFLLDRKVGQLTHYLDLSPQPDRLSSESIISLMGDSRGYLWIGTVNNGVNRLDPLTGTISHFDRVQSGLPDDRITGLIEDQDGFVWLATGRGVARLDPKTRQVRQFSEVDGLQRGAFHPGAITRLANGALLFGGASGFNVIHPGRLPSRPNPKAPVVAGLSLSGEPIHPTKGGILERPISETAELRLPFDPRNRLSFRFAPRDLVGGERNIFRFRLEGLDLSWSIAGNDDRAVYTGLDPGRYQLIAQSSHDGQNWSEETAGLSLVIQPPWHRSWWAKILFAMGTALLLWLVSNWVGRARVWHQRHLLERAEQQRDKAEAELARQLQHALLLEQAGRELGQNRDAAALFRNALRIVAEQFGASRCSIIACAGKDQGLDSDDSECLLQSLASYRSGEAEGNDEIETVTVELDAALRETIRNHELRIVSGNEIADAEGAIHPLLEKWSSGDCLILRRTSFLDEPNGVIVLQLPLDKKGGLTASEIQMLEVLANQMGTAIAQWRVARQERNHRRVLDQARRTAESANLAKSEFLAKMTHELRTPLNAILGFSEVMNEDSELNDRQREVMAIINNSGEHLHEVINGVLDLAKIEAGKIEIHPARFDLERMLRSLHKMLSLRAGSKGLEFPFEMLTALPNIVETDKGKVRQVLINLLGNSIKFTEEGSIKLVVWAEATGDVKDDAGVRKRPVRIHFEVRDTGCGIAENEIDQLFDQYSQAESGKGAADSTGLGLAIAKAFVELLGGEVKVESVLGEGTTFRLSIACDEVSVGVEEAMQLRGETSPAIGATLPGGKSRSGGASINRRNLAADQSEVRILIAEDQLPNRLLLRKLLEPAGFVLREAVNGEVAVEMWREWHPHLILMDEQMPKMTGREATRAIVTEATQSDDFETAGDGGPLPVIVALTAFALDQSRSAAIESGCSDFLAKPFRSDELFGVIARNLPQVRFAGAELTKDTNSESVMLAG